MGDSKTKLNHFIERAVPSNIRDEHPQFSLFIEKYFEYISRDLGEYDLTSSLLDYLNVDQTVSAFYEDFKSMYAPLLPEKYKTALSVLVKNIKLFYQTKGTEDSFKIFFRMIFDTTVNLYYPKVDMLRASDGRWIEPYYLYPTDQSGVNLQYFYDKIIEGSVTNATAYVKEVLQVIDPQDSNATVYVLSLVDRTGVFASSDIITVQGEVTPNTTLDGLDPIIVGAGYWEGTDGFLSWNKYIQDSEYYQDYSYVLESNVSADLIEKAIKENVHPAGMKFFAIVVADVQLEQVGTELASFIDHIIDWIRTENVEQTINSISQELATLSVAPKYTGGNDFDWKYFEAHREETAFIQLYPAETFDSFPIDFIDDNYPENYVTVTIGGVPTTAFTLINEQLTLDTPLGSNQFIIVTATDFTIPENSRVYRFSGTTGESTFILPTKIHRMELGAETESPVYPPLSRNIATFDGTNYGTLDTPIVFTGDFEVVAEAATAENTTAIMALFGGTSIGTWVGSNGTVDRLGMVLDSYNSANIIPVSVDPYDGKLHEWKVTRVGTTLSLYIDGILQDTGIGAGDPITFAEIGITQTNLLYNWIGQILSVKFSDTRLRTNECLWNRDLSNGVWLQTNTPTLVQDQKGIDGVVNTAWTVGDNDVVNNESLYQDITIPDDNATHAIHTYILLEDDQTTFPEIAMQLINGTTTQHIETQINKKSGVIINRDAVGTVSSSVESVLLGGRNWWKLTQTVQNNTSGNNAVRIRIYGAATSVWNSWDATVTGSCVIDAPQIELDRSDTMWNIFTQGTPVSVDSPIVTDYVIDSGSLEYQLPVDEELTNINLVANGEMEGTYTGGLAPSWSATGSPIPTQVAGRSGSAQGVESPVAGGDVVQQTVPMVVGKAYLIKGWIKVASGSGTATLRVVTGFDGGNFNIGETTDSDWVEVSGVGIANATTTFLRIYSSGTGVVAALDDVTFQQLPDSVCLLTSFTSADWNTYFYRKFLSHDSGLIYTSWLGEDLVTNGTFDTDTDWVKGVSWSIGSGIASSDGTGGAFNVIQQSTIPIIDGNVYLTKHEIVSTFGHVDFAILEQLVNSGEWYGTGDSIGVKTKVQTAAGSATLKRFGSNGTGAGGSVDNVSVKHLLELAYR